jgi:hypothetical protein
LFYFSCGEYFLLEGICNIKTTFLQGKKPSFVVLEGKISPRVEDFQCGMKSCWKEESGSDFSFNHGMKYENSTAKKAECCIFFSLFFLADISSII